MNVEFVEVIEIVNYLISYGESVMKSLQTGYYPFPQNMPTLYIPKGPR
jgi:hypothetical protein